MPGSIPGFPAKLFTNEKDHQKNRKINSFILQPGKWLDNSEQ